MRSKLNGIVVVDKPADLSSARAVAEIKRLFGAAKVGHAGTLDPFATGVLLCCVNQATRLARFFLGGTKQYDALLRLGIETQTQDATGAVTARSDVPALSAADIEAVLQTFRGQQMQYPPLFSALKHQGTALYKLARKGTPVQKPPRPINIARIRVLWIDLPHIRFEVVCSAGTYIRTLCADIGRSIGCGGHLVELRRTAASGFGIDTATPLQALRDMQPVQRKSVMIPMAEALRRMPAVYADPSALDKIAQGQRLTWELLPPPAVAADQISEDGQTFIKVLDSQNALRAVVKTAPDDGGYVYCCVFH